MLTKKQCRSQARVIWKEFLGADGAGALVAGLVQALRAQPPATGRVFAYVALPGEFNPLPALDETDWELAAPCTTGPEAMEFRRLSPGDRARDLSPDFRGIPSPTGGQLVVPGQGDVVLLPGLASNPSFRRLGRGAGYYDRYAAARPEFLEARLLGMLPAKLCELPYAEAAHDLRYHAIVTEKGLIAPG